MGGVDVGPLRPASNPPVVELPRGDNGIKTRIFLETAVGEAGCCVCKRPIPKGITRVKIVVGLFPPKQGRNEESYYTHPKCLTKRPGSEVRRSRTGCWDCGDEPVEGREHPNMCFTVARFAWGRLCERCTAKPRWEECLSCHVYYPSHMVAHLARIEEPTTPFAILSISSSDLERACVHCIDRHKLPTLEQMQAEVDQERLARASERLKFERTRKKILEEGLDAPTGKAGS